MAINVTSASGDNFSLGYGARNIIRNSNGVPYIAARNDTDNSICVYKGNAADPSSFAEQDSSGTNKPSATIINAVSAEIDESDYIHIVWIDDIGKDSVLKHIRFRADGTNDDWFEAATNIYSLSGDPLSSTALFTSVTVDYNGDVHVAFTDFDAIMGTDTYVCLYLNNIGGSWNATVQVYYVSGSDASSIHIATDDYNIPVITMKPSRAALGNATNATSFTLQQFTTDVLYAPSMVIDRSSTVWVLARNSTDNKVTLYKHLFDDSWATWSEHQSASDGASLPQPYTLALAGDSLYAFYEDASNNIVYDVFDGTSWAGVSTLETGTYENPIALWSRLSHIASDADHHGFIDGYNNSGSNLLNLNNSTGWQAQGQGFTAHGGKLEYVEFDASHTNTPTGTVYAKLYASTGTLGTDATPTGSALATSYGIDPNNLLGWTTFTFSTPYTLTEGTDYFIVLEYTAGTSSDYVRTRYYSAGTHYGNAARYNGTIWSAYSSDDMFFRLGYEAPPELTYIFLDSSSDIMFGTLELTATGPQTTTLVTPTAVSSAQAITVLPGAIATTLLTPSTTTSAETVTVTLTAVTLLTEASLTTSAEAASVLTGLATTLLTSAQSATSAPAAQILTGLVSTLLAEASLTTSAETVTNVLASLTLLQTISANVAAEPSAIVTGLVSTLLTEASLTTSAEAASVLTGLATTLLTSAQSATSAPSAQVITGLVSTLLAEATATTNAEAANILTGLISTLLNEATINAAAQTATITTAITTLLQTISLASSAETVTILPGIITTLLTEASLATNTETITVLTETAILLQTISTSISAETINILPGIITILLTEASLATSAEAASILTGITTILLTEASLATSAEAITLLPGLATTLLSEATITATAEIINNVVGSATLLQTISIASNAEAASIITGLVSTLLAEATTLTTAEATTVQAGIATLLQTLAANTNAEAISILPGQVATLLEEAQLLTAAQATSISTGAIATLLQTLSQSTSAEPASLIPGLATINLATIATTIQADNSATLTGAVSTILNTPQVTVQNQIVAAFAVFIAYSQGIVLTPDEISAILIPDEDSTADTADENSTVETR